MSTTYEVRTKLLCSRVLVQNTRVRDTALKSTEFLGCRILALLEFATVAGGFVEKRLLLDTGAAASAIPAEWVRDEGLPPDRRLLVRDEHRWGFAPHRWAGEHHDVEEEEYHTRVEEIAALECRFIAHDGQRTPAFLLPAYLIEDRRYLPRPVLGLLGILTPHSILFQHRGGRRQVYDAGVHSIEVESTPCQQSHAGWRVGHGALRIRLADGHAR
ncbi:MAG: hypothetical protein FJ291_02720 [Planctomycetes bacterium]|nr:hypothetical protein [Planctomycetota bacterium]